MANPLLKISYKGYPYGIEQLRGSEVETSLIYSDNINTDVNIKQTYEQTQ